MRNWIKRHKFWAVIISINLIAFPFSVAGIVDIASVAQLCGFAVGVYGFWWLSQRGKARKKEATND